MDLKNDNSDDKNNFVIYLSIQKKICENQIVLKIKISLSSIKRKLPIIASNVEDIFTQFHITSFKTHPSISIFVGGHLENARHISIDKSSDESFHLRTSRKAEMGFVTWSDLAEICICNCTCVLIWRADNGSSVKLEKHRRRITCRILQCKIGN
ncbi:hypothetical protein T05_16073 [Trichinella murrelli]|uniref:Uncharacterized protein n=1 Tax=Trichinella murrelli TaxID=144512 RepID=A0A0V0U5C3_9BILA|nr:hypothetical protein T05_16073 [Trichinella murrelli]